MKIFKISIEGRVATYLKREGALICDNTDNVIAFTFDSEWDAHPTKTARFIWGGAYKDVEFIGAECPVPRIHGAKEVQVGVYVGTLDAPGDLWTTTAAVIPCKDTILGKSGTAQPDVLPPYRDQAIAAAARAEEAANRAEAVVGDLSTVLEALNEGGLT